MAQQSTVSPTLAALAVLALELAAYLGLLAWPRRASALQPVGMLFVAGLFRALLDTVLEEAVRR